MQTLALIAERAPFRAMREDDALPAREAEQQLLGRALRALRERAKLTQGAAAMACRPSMTAQAWQKYESGERKFTRDTIDRLTAAIGGEAQDLVEERARILGDDVPVRPSPLARRGGSMMLPVWGRARAGPEGPQVYELGEPERYIDFGEIVGRNTRATVVAGESMSPWASSGSVVLYDVSAWPRRDEGCVVELEGGEMLVKLYKRTDGSALYLEELCPERRELRIPMSKVKGVYAVTFRGS